MKIEAGKYYKTHDGRKAFVSYIDIGNPFASDDEWPPSVFNVRGWIEGNYVQMRWSDTGHGSASAVNPINLVAEWVDPPTPLEVLKEIRECLECHRKQGGMRFDFGSVLQERMEQAIAAAETK